MLQPLNKECSRQVVRIVEKWNEVTCLQKKINFISCRLQSTNNIASKRAIVRQTKRYGIQKVQWIKHIKFSHKTWMTWICNFTSFIHKQTIPVITLKCIKTYMIVMIVCNSKLYMTGYVLSKLASILQPMARLLSFHDLSYAPNYVYAFS